MVSRTHVVEPFELEDGTWWLECMFVARVISGVTKAKKMNYEIHGNTVAHLHLHIYRRIDGDPFEGRPIDGTARLFWRSAAELDLIRTALLDAARQEGLHAEAVRDD